MKLLLIDWLPSLFITRYLYIGSKLNIKNFLFILINKMLVTSFYDIYNKPERVIEYVQLFYKLGISGIQIIVFTDPSLVHKFNIFPPSVKVVGIPLELFELYNMGMSYNRELPNNKSETKDTKEFLSLMNTKIEFILRASELCNDDTLIWIDFGILKIVKNTELFINKLKSINEKSFDKITIPGCWDIGRRFSVDEVNWRFCGGFIVMPRKHIKTFFHHSKNVLTDFCTLPIYKLTWETNVWNIVEFFACKDIIQWYQADHNDSIILNIDNITNLI
jgi:hypothetical protein